jgi:hypothetical protein
VNEKTCKSRIVKARRDSIKKHSKLEQKQKKKILMRDFRAIITNKNLTIHYEASVFNLR